MTTKHLWSIIGVMFALIVSLVGYVFASSSGAVREQGMEIARQSTRLVIVESGQAEIIRRLERIERKIDRVTP
ncbi:MAG: hypothetical protein QME66_08230 [Candidatus Eisenbacteria bacterium]|nr:hypothetical protein [Candidatus Eisenbacteria bacterium]